MKIKEIVELNHCVAEISPEEWDAIASKKKTVIFSDDWLDVDYIIFLKPDDRDCILGEVQVLRVQPVYKPSANILDSACMTMSDLARTYPRIITDGILVDTLYAHHIRPVALHDVAYDVLDKIM